MQAVDRLLRQADDAEADQRIAAAEQFHLERVQLLGHTPALGSEAACVHDVYAKLGELCCACHAVINPRADIPCNKILRFLREQK